MKQNIKRSIVATAVAVPVLALAFATPASGAASVDSSDIVNQTIQSWDIDRGGVASSEIRNGSIQPWDLDPEFRAVVESGGSQGPAGEQGEKGDTGDTGEAGADGVSGYEVVGQEVVLPAGETVNRIQECPTGKVATGGGYKVDNPTDVVVHRSMPANLAQTDGVWSSNGWEVQLTNNGAKKTNMTSFVMCANA